MNTGEDDDWTAFEAEMDDVVVGDAANVSVLTDVELLDKYQELTQELLSRKEAINPRTPTGRDLHSLRAACVVEINRRHLK